MRKLEEIMLNGDKGIKKEANLMSKVYMPIALAGGLAAIGRELVAPVGQRIMAAADHSSVLKKLKENYPPEKHEMLAEVYGVVLHTAPHMARNYLIAKTLVDQKMSVMEQLSGSHPAGVQIPLPTLEQAIKMEKDVTSAHQSRAGAIETEASKALVVSGLGDMGMLTKRSSDPVDEYIDFLEGLI